MFRSMLFAIFICLAVFLTGCWDIQEPDEIGIIIMVAFDIDEDDGFTRVVAQVANPLGAGGAEEAAGGLERDPTWTIEATGRSTYDAVKNLEVISTRSLLWSHVEVIIFSEAMAEQGLLTIVDFFDRERQSRLINRPLVLKGDVNQLQKVEFPLEVLGGMGMSKQIVHVQNELSVISDVDSMRLMFQRLSAPGWDLVLPLAELGPEESDDDNEDAAEEEEVPGESKIDTSVNLSGSAVFRGEKLVGLLNDRESSGYLWITGGIRRSTLYIKCPGCDEALLSVEIYQAETELEPNISEGKPQFDLEVRAAGRIQDSTCPEFPADKEFMEVLNRRKATVIRNDIEMSLDRARELRADIFGFGNLIFRKDLDAWEELDEDWPELFSEAEVEIEVNTTIRRHGQITEPITVR